MSDVPPTHAQPAPSRPAQVATGAAQVGEFFLRDQLISTVGFLSLITLLLAAAAPSAPHVVLLVLVGLAGVVASVLVLVRRWSAGRTWLTLGGLLVVDVGALALTFA